MLMSKSGRERVSVRDRKEVREREKKRDKVETKVYRK